MNRDLSSGIPARLTAMAAQRLSAEDLDTVRDRLSKAPADRVFNAAETAIYTGRSVRTIKRAIDAGVGPKRQKNPSTNPQPWKTTNQHTRFRKGELDDWMKGITSFESAWSGSFRDFDDVVKDEPWIVLDGSIHGHLLDAGDIELVLDLLEAELVEFLRIDEALAERWVSTNARRPYQKAFLSILRQAEDLAASTDDVALIDDETGEAKGDSRPDPRL